MSIIKVSQATKNYGSNASEFRALKGINLVKGVVSLWN